MTLQELYLKINGNFAEAQGRLMKDSFIEKFALMYLKDDSFINLQAAVDAENIADSFRAAHTLKGVAANLAFTELQLAATNLTEQLRPQTETANMELYTIVKAAHEKVVNTLNEYSASKS